MDKQAKTDAPSNVNLRSDLIGRSDLLGRTDGTAKKEPAPSSQTRGKSVENSVENSDEGVVVQKRMKLRPVKQDS